MCIAPAATEPRDDSCPCRSREVEMRVGRAGTITGLSLLLAAAPGPGIHAGRADAASLDNAVVQWNTALLQAVTNTRFAPMLTARALAITHTCMYDAWAAYDAVAHGVNWPTDLRQPATEHTLANKSEAVSFAARAALVDLFPSQAPLFDALLASLGYALPGMPGNIGLQACGSVLESRHHDGSNQLGDLHPGSYSDYTGYAPVNTPEITHDPNRWQPLIAGGAAQQFLTPHWGLVTPFALTSLAATRPGPPPRYPHGSYIKETNQILHLSAGLDDRSKMIAEYWSDGP